MILTHIILFAFLDGAGGVVASAGRAAMRLKARVRARVTRARRTGAAVIAARKALEQPIRGEADLPFTLPEQSAPEPLLVLALDIPPLGLGVTDLQAMIDLAANARERGEEELIIQWAIG